MDPQVQLSFLHAILSDPEDEAPRLIYADWLQDHGDPLGELVRVQTELGRIDTGRSRREELARRERELLGGFGFDRPGRTAHEIDYDGLHPLPGEWNFAVRDGVPLLFISGLLLPDRTLPSPPPEWVQRFGWYVIRIGFYDSYEYRYELDDDVFRALLASPLMERCIGLDLNDVQRSDCASILAGWPGVSRLLQLRLREAGCTTELLTSPHLSGLLDLDVGKNYLSAESLLALAASCAATGLRRLGLASCSDEVSAAVAVLANSPRLSRLRSLDLSRNRLGGDAIRALSEGSALANLAELDLSANEELSDADALALIRSSHLPGLRRLHLAGTSTGTPTVEALCESERFLRCGELNLWGNSVTDEALAVVADSPNASRLRRLTAGHAACTDATAEALAASSHLTNLRMLNLSFSQISAGGAEALTESPALLKLEELLLTNNPLGDRGALALARWGRQRGLTELRLAGVGLTAKGLAQLADAGLLAGLTTLELDDNAIGDAGAAVLAGCADLRTLRQLWLWDVGMTDEGAAALIASPHLSRELTPHGLSLDLSEQARADLRGRFARP